MKWPDGKRFAFTIFDDTDRTTMSNGPEMYRFLHDLGMRTTKSVWPLQGAERPKIGGMTCADEPYREWVQALQAQGFEIALHNATFHTSARAQALAGLEEFRRLFGAYPRIHVNHADCRDAVYWGSARVSGLNRLAYDVVTRYSMRDRAGGSTESSPYFWGDRCKEHVEYVRNFVYTGINTLKYCPMMPYHDPRLPYVNHWFASSDGGNGKRFMRTIGEANQESLVEEGGACIMYTHFGFSDFFENGKLHPRFVKLMTDLAARGGWFVPVSELLDHLRVVRAPHGFDVISRRDRDRIERRWLLEKVFVSRGTS
ncbi:MAG: hypothetical protein H0X68_07295 [Chloroflexi bacterium]|nr:hypothetical protein [Chloroflexota bacterium]